MCGYDISCVNTVEKLMSDDLGGVIFLFLI